MNGCTESQFELQKIKVLKGGSGIEIDFNVQRSDSGANVIDRYSKTSVTFPHPDLLKGIEALKDILIIAVGKETIHTERILAGFKTQFKKDPEFKKLEDAFESHINGEKLKVTVSGISISGFDANRGVIITGTYLCKNGAKIALNSPRIRFEGETFGFEEECQKLCKVVEDEAYQYTFKDKQAQQSIAFEGDGDNKGEE